MLWRAVCRRMLRRFRRRVHDARGVNRATLVRILTAAAATQIGKQYDFADILRADDPVAAFRERVPVRDYAAHAAAIDAIAHGAADVLFPGQPTMFIATSGTSSDPKLLPTNRLQQNSALEHIALLTPAMRWEAAPELTLSQRSINLMLASNPANAMPGGVPLGMSSAGGLRKVLRAAPYIWTSPTPVFELTEHSAALYLHALFGLLDKDAGCVEAIFGTHIVSWVAMLSDRRDELIHDIATGTVNAALPLSPAARRRIEARLTPNPKRAREIAEAFAAGEAQLLRRLWPRLRVLSTVVSGGFAVSQPRLRWLAGPDVRIGTTCFGATECMVGINLWPEQHDRYALSVGAGFFEFLPLTPEDAAPVRMEEVELGQCYEIVLTSFAGLFRYPLGDVVRICDFVDATPVFEFDHRRGDVLDLVGEKTTERHTQAAVLSVAQSGFGSANAIANYTLVGASEAAPYHYRVYLELVEDAADRLYDRARLAGQFDEALQQINLSYRTLARANQRLGMPEVRIVRAGTFAQLEELQYRRADGVSRNQVKVPRVLKDPQQIALLEAGVVAER